MEIFVILAGIITDQLTKFSAISIFKENPVVIIKGILSFTYVENFGAAFSMFENAYFILVPFSLLVTVFCGYFAIKARKASYKRLSVAISMVISGAVGNLIDRISRGFVVDFISADFINFPVFNVADILVVTGSVLTVALIFFTKEGSFLDSSK
jgi:signal peptidase II